MFIAIEYLSQSFSSFVKMALSSSVEACQELEKEKCMIEKRNEVV
jgi:hypothetical protein